MRVLSSEKELRKESTQGTLAIHETRWGLISSTGKNTYDRIGKQALRWKCHKRLKKGVVRKYPYLSIATI